MGPPAAPLPGSEGLATMTRACRMVRRADLAQILRQPGMSVGSRLVTGRATAAKRACARRIVAAIHAQAERGR